MLASAVCLPPLDSSPSKTYKRALKFEVFLCFPKKNYEKLKKVMKFLTGLCQDDVTTSSDDVISRKKLHSHVREKILGKVTEGILKIGYGSGVTQQKVGLGVNSRGQEVLRGTDDCVLWNFIISQLYMFSRTGNPLLTFLLSYLLRVTSKTSSTGSLPRFSRSPKLGSSVGISPMDSLTSKT